MSQDLETLYRELRPYSFAIAYRMLGSVAEAEEVVQEAFLRLDRARPEVLDSPKAYLAKITTRLAIDALRSARMSRQTYYGHWLPEPLISDPAHTVDPVEMADSLSMAFLAVLEQLTPVERAVFLLHDVFDYSYSEISGILEKSEANCRQLASRARRALEQQKPRFEASREQRDELAAQFLSACEGQDMGGLLDLLAADAVLYGDGGSKGSGLKRPIYGRENLAGVLLAWFSRGARLKARVEPVQINGQPGAKLLDAEGRLINVLALDIADGQIQTVRSIINPDKLAHLGELSPIGRRTSDPEAEW